MHVQNPAPSIKFFLGPEGFNWLASAINFDDRVPFIRAQLSLRASSRYRSVARSGGLEKKKKKRVNMCTYQKQLMHQLAIFSTCLINIPVRTPFGHRSRHHGVLPP